MTPNLLADLEKARDLVGARRLDEATALILASLGGSALDRTSTAGPNAPSFSGPTIDLAAASTGTGPKGRIETAESRDRAPSTASREKPGWTDRLADVVAKAGARLPVDLKQAPRFPLPGSRQTPVLKIPAGARYESRSYAGPFGHRNYKLYVPSTGGDGSRPLVVMLHGCTQDPDDFAAGTNMNAHAEKAGILVVYPEQPASANAQKCWNWFDPAHQDAHRGEPAIIAGIVDDVAAHFEIDRARIFAAGLSAGGAMAAILGATDPDRYAAVGVHSGLPHGAAHDVGSALGVMRSGKSPASSRPRRRTARMIVFHGAGDRTVHPANGAALADGVAGPAAHPTKSRGSSAGRAYERTVVGGDGRPATMEYWRVDGLGHAWSGGDAAGSYSDPSGPDASAQMLRFFLDTPGPV